MCNMGVKKNKLKIWWSDLWSAGNTTNLCQYSVLPYFWVPRGLLFSFPLKSGWLSEMSGSDICCFQAEVVNCQIQEFLALSSSIQLDPK